MTAAMRQFRGMHNFILFFQESQTDVVLNDIIHWDSLMAPKMTNSNANVQFLRVDCAYL